MEKVYKFGKYQHFKNISKNFQSTLEEMRQTCAVICRYYLTGDWKFINSDEIVFKRIM